MLQTTKTNSYRHQSIKEQPPGSFHQKLKACLTRNQIPFTEQKETNTITMIIVINKHSFTSTASSGSILS
jgi:hypothetical protein